MRPKLIVILGPTASGKSFLAIKLARKFNGEIISADSRQVYRGLDIGAGKVSKKEQRLIPHHLLDIVSAKKQFTVAEFKPLALKAMDQIRAKDKLPFLVGGTPFYIYATIDDLAIPEVAPNWKLRKQLKKKSAAQLFQMLKKLDPRRAETIDAKNPVRLMRAIEIVKTTGQAVPNFSQVHANKDILILGLKKSQTELNRLIDLRVKQRFQAGLIAETKKLLRSGVTHDRLGQIGLTYRIVAQGLKNKIPTRLMIPQVQTAEKKFSKRQMTWFRTDSRINWITTQKQAEKLIRKYLRT